MNIRRYFRRNRRDADRKREIQAHLALETDRQMARGVPPDEARRLAHVQFGSPTLVREAAYTLPVDGLIQDLRYALRQIRHSPTFAAVTILTIALGMGANTAIFSAIHVALLRLLPVRSADRLVLLNTTSSIEAQSGEGDSSLTYHIFETLRPMRPVFADLVAFAPLNGNPVSVRYSGGAEPGGPAEEALVELVSGDFFSGLGVAPARGRIFTRADESAHAAVAVLRYDYWLQRFDRNSSVIGDTILVEGEPFQIVGVAAPQFAGVEHEKVTDVWIPLQARSNLQPWDQRAGLTIYGTSPRWWCLKVIGRLQSGVTSEQAKAAAGPLFEWAALDGAAHPPKAPDVPHLYLTPVRGIDGMRENFGRPLTTVMVMAAAVLLMACLNIGTLLVVRGSARTREFALRLALGAGRLRLARQLLVESALLVGLGATLGWAFAVWATRALSMWAGLNLNFAPDGTVLLATLSASVAVAVAFALAPLGVVGRLDPAASLKTWGAAAYLTGRGRARDIALAAQMAMCLVLLIGGALLVQSLDNLDRVDLGMHPGGLLVFDVNSHADSDQATIRFFDSLLTGLKAVPGVDGVTLLGNRPGSGWSSNSGLRVDGAAPAANARVRYNVAGPDLVKVLGASLIAGRDLTEADSASAPLVALVNSTLAKKYLGGSSALGHTISSATGPPRTIVGIVADMKYTGTREDTQPMAWYPYPQTTGRATMTIEVRSAIPLTEVMPAVRQAIHSLAPDVALVQPMTQTEQFERSYVESRLAGHLALLFGLLAILLVATGLYGTLAYTVSRRTAEIGVRMALGAKRRQVVWGVMRRTLVAVGAGLGVGFALARLATHFLASMLYGVRSGDPRYPVAALAILLGCALVASWMPAARASSIDPVTALRQE